MEIQLSDAQYEFVSCEDQFPAFCGGFGSGKTYAAVARALSKKMAYPKQNVAYYLPTYDLVRTIGFPRFAEMGEEFHIPCTFNKTEATITFGDWGQLIFRTMDTPERIIGYEVCDSLVDELDTLPKDKATEVWNRILSRNRQKKPDESLNTVGVATTPEGFNFVYDKWVRKPGPGYRLIRAPTMSNKHLPAGYVDSLRASYPSQLLSAYLDGEFVNLEAGSVYTGYNRKLNMSHEVALPNDTLHIGIDFNVMHMAAVVHVYRGGKAHAVDELVEVFDTPSIILLLRARYPKNPIMVYPDATGKNRKSQNASESDHSLLRAAHFVMCVNNQNPEVKDRVLSVNKLLESREYRVNSDLCPMYAEALEKQPYNKFGEPDKTIGLDHVVDAGGYFVCYRFPLIRRTSNVVPLRA